MKRRLPYLFLLTALCFNLCVQAQQTIKGTLHSATGDPIVGATIAVKGTRNQTTSDASGQFSINAPVGSTIIVSYIGYATREVDITDENPVTLVLQQTNAEMQQVVVIGYQSVRRKDLTGATGIVNMTDVSKITAQSVGEAIQGTVPGVSVRNGGAPGSEPVIEIRGVSSWNGTKPLFVIDGMLADANTSINPDDVASIQVLKDASAAAIY